MNPRDNIRENGLNKVGQNGKTCSDKTTETSLPANVKKNSSATD